MDTLTRVQNLTAERGISIYRLAQMSGISYSTINTSKKRNGQLSVDILERICDALGISLAEFFADDEQLPALQAIRFRLKRGALDAEDAENEGVCKSCSNF